jgi:hypothetical protein
VHRQTGLGAGEEDDAANVAEDEGGAGVCGVEDILDREGVGAGAGDEVGEAAVDVAQTLGEAEAGPGDEGAALEQAVSPPVGLQEAVARAL